MSTILNSGKTNFTFKREDGVHNIVGIYGTLSITEQQVFDNHFIRIVENLANGDRVVIEKQDDGNWIKWVETSISNCECRSNLGNEIRVTPGSTGTLVNWRWSNVENINVNLSPEAPNNVCHWLSTNDNSEEEAAAYLIYNTSGDLMFGCYFDGSMSGMAGDSVEFINGQNYVFKANPAMNEIFSLTVPGEYDNVLEEESYDMCMGNPTYCQDYFIEYGICPDSSSEEHADRSGCLYWESHTLQSNSSDTDFTFSLDNEYEIWMDLNTPSPFMFSGFDDSDCYILNEVLLHNKGSVNYMGGVCSNCDSHPPESSAGGNQGIAACCAYQFGGSANLYVTEANTSCNYEWPFWGFPDTPGYSCWYPEPPAGYEACGVNINEFENITYCTEDTSCVALPSTNLGGQCVDGANPPWEEWNNNCPEGTILVTDDMVDQYPGASQYIQDWNDGWGEMVAGWISGCCYEMSSDDLQYTCVHDDQLGNFETNYYNLETTVWVGAEQFALADPQGFLMMSLYNYDELESNVSDIWISGDDNLGPDPRKLCALGADLQGNFHPEYDLITAVQVNHEAAVFEHLVGEGFDLYYCYAGEVAVYGCMDTTACNYNLSAELHNQSMCSYEVDCAGYCQRLIDGSYNGFSIWSEDVCGMCSTTHPWFEGTPMVPNYYLTECGECRASNKVNIAIGENGWVQSPSTEDTHWFEDWFNLPFSTYTGEQVCQAYSDNSCAAIEVQLGNGEWVLLNEIPQTYQMNGTPLYSSHNVNDYLIHGWGGFESTGCEIDWEQMINALVFGESAFDGTNGMVPFRGIRAACGNSPTLYTTEGTNWTYGILNTSFEGTIEELLEVRGNTANDPVNNGDMETLHFMSVKPASNGYSSAFWSIIPFQNEDYRDWKFTIVEVVEESDMDNRVKVLPNNLSVDNTSFTFEIGKKYNFKVVYDESLPDPTPGIENDLSKFTVLGNNISYYDTILNNYENQTMGFLNCCEDINNNGLCDNPTVPHKFCRNETQLDWMSDYPYLESCGDYNVPDMTLTDYHINHGDVNGCMDENATNYNPSATHNIPANVCMYTVPFDIIYSGGQLGSSINTGPDANPTPSSDMHVISKQMKVDIIEDEATIDRILNFWDYNYTTHNTIWTMEEIIDDISILSEQLNGLSGQLEQGMIKNFQIDTSKGVNGLEHMGDIGTRSYNNVSYPNVHRYQLHLKVTPSSDVVGEFDDLLYISLKNPYNNLKTELWWNVTVVSQNDYPKIKTVGPNLITDSTPQLGSWGSWTSTRLWDNTTNNNKIVFNNLIGPGTNNNDDFKNVMWLKDTALQIPRASNQETPNEVTHANTHGNGSTLRIPHRTETGQASTSNQQFYTSLEVAAGTYVISFWVKYVSGHIPSDDELEFPGSFISTTIRRHSWPWTIKNTLDITDAVKISKNEGGSWKRIEVVYEWDNDGYKATTEAYEDYNQIDTPDKWAIPKFCGPSSGLECTYPSISYEDAVQKKNIYVWNSNRWYKMTDEKQLMRVAIESQGAPNDETQNNIQIGVYGVQVERAEDYVSYEATIEDGGLLYEEGKRFTTKKEDKYYILGGVWPMNSNVQEPSWDYDAEDNDYCEPRLMYKFTTIRDKRHLSEVDELGNNLDGYLWQPLEDGPDLHLVNDCEWRIDMHEQAFQDMEDNTLRQDYTMLMQLADADNTDCPVWTGVAPTPYFPTGSTTDQIISGGAAPQDQQGVIN